MRGEWLLTAEGEGRGRESERGGVGGVPLLPPLVASVCPPGGLAMGCAVSRASSRTASAKVAAAPPVPSTSLFVRPPSAERSDLGLAETPIGARAAEYKFFCPLCMLYFKEILATPCCEAYICATCHADFVNSNARKVEGSSSLTLQPSGLGSAEGSVIAPRCIPRGLECPHCAVASTGAPLKQLHRFDKARSYTDSPSTRAAMAKREDGAVPPESPLRVGDDFSTMARKFKWIETGKDAAGNEREPNRSGRDALGQSHGSGMLGQSIGARLTMEAVAECGSERLSAQVTEAQRTSEASVSSTAGEVAEVLSNAVTVGTEGSVDASGPTSDMFALQIARNAIARGIAATVPQAS